MNQVNAYIDHMLDKHIMPGCVYAFVTDKDAEIHVKGMKNKIDEMTEDTVFDLASLTKVIGTTTVILQLMEEGRLTLDDKVADYLPIQNQQLTIRHLLTHTSDFQGYIMNRDQLKAQPLAQALLDEMQPGESMGKVVTYSDINFLYLGWIIEYLEQCPVQKVIHKRVIQPLHLKTMTFHPKDDDCAPTEGTLQGCVHDPKTQRLQAHSGSAGLFSNISDLIRFVQCYLNGGNPLLKDTTINQLPTSYSNSERPYSLGWNLEIVNHHYVLTHTGYTGTYLLIDLNDKQGFIFLSNRIHPVDDKETYILHRDQLIQTYIKERENH